MALELDHVFCFCSPDLPEVKILEAAGFSLTPGRTHEGQGTANRSVMFQSSYLELIYLASEEQALSNPLGLHRRGHWKTTGRSPFGIALRGEIPAEDRSGFWEYRPPYNPSRSIMMHRLSEESPGFPLLFVMPSLPLSGTQRENFRDFTGHKNGATHITRLTIRTPVAKWPLSINVKGLHLEESPLHGMSVELDGVSSFTFSALRLNELLEIFQRPVRA